MNAPEYVVETAWKIYSEVAHQKLTMGRSIEAFVAASLYASIRIHEFPRMLEELCELALIPLRSVHHALGLIVQNVLPVLNLKYRHVTPESLVFRFGNDRHLSFKTQQIASKILTDATKNGLQGIGKDPKGLAAAVLYLATRGGNERKTQTEIAKVAHVTEVTLRTRVKQIKTLGGSRFIISP
jgi:transcription initiation factor TFIIB